MTTIAYDGKTIAADSRETHSSEAGGVRKHTCQKLFRKRVGKHDVIIATAGETTPGMMFKDWYGSGKDLPQQLKDGNADFDCLILTRDGLYEADGYCFPVKRDEVPYAIGSGAKEAMTAMRCGKSAVEAVRMAALSDPYTGGRVHSMTLQCVEPAKAPAKKKKK